MAVLTAEAVPEVHGRAQQTIPGVILEQARRLGPRTHIRYFEDGEWKAVSWEEFAEAALGVACALVKTGLKEGDHVALISENRLEWLYADLGIQAAGCVPVPIYPTSTSRVIRHIVEDCAIPLAITSSPALAAKLNVTPPLRRVVLVDELRNWATAPRKPELMAEVERRLDALDPKSVATVVYTSGTTGMPKGVMLTHANFVEMAVRALEAFPMSPDDVIVSFLPYSHVLERIDGIFVPSTAGVEIWISRGTDFIVEDIAFVRPTIMLGVPRVFEKVYSAVYDQVRRGSAVKRLLFNWAMGVAAARLTDTAPGGWLSFKISLAERLVLHGLRDKLTGGRLRFFISGGAPLNQKVEEFFWQLGVKILQGWGLTETTSGVCSNTESEHRYRTVGKAFRDIEIKTADDGELLVRGPAVMVGYKNLPEKTAEVLDPEGWFRTGDMGVIDKDGFITITDRKKDLIKTAGGKYVAPLPIEATLHADRYVKASLVLGDERPYVIALIVPDWEALAADGIFTGDPATLARDPAVRGYFQRKVDAVNQDLASFETVKRFALLERDFTEEADELTPSFKTKRRVIAEHYRTVVDGLYAEPREAVPA
jgi:long-chain acyl-CoA synthetase